MRAIVAVLVALLAPCSLAQQILAHRDLLKPLEGEALSDITRPTNYDLREELYFARRYAIVEVDFSLLEKQHEVFTISPWADLTIEVAGESIAGPASFAGNRQWRGRAHLPAREFSIWITAGPTATFDLPLPALVTQLRMRPLKGDRRYHLVYELDPTKMAVGPQADINRKRFAEFKQALDRERETKPDGSPHPQG